MMFREYFEGARLLRMGLVILMGIVAISLEAAPFGLEPDAPPSPDILLCVVAYWSVRQPESIPVAIVFLLGLTRDLLTDLPVGAGLLALLLASEAFKLARRRLARTSFLREWLAVALAALLSAFLAWILVIVTFAQPPYLLLLLHQVLYTAMLYPAMALTLRWGLRIGWSQVERTA